MSIEIFYESGNHSVVSTPLFGLMYWLLEQSEESKCESCGNVISPQTIFREDDPQLIPTVVTAIKKKWNKKPEFSKTDNEEDQAFAILQWLLEKGDIAQLTMGKPKSKVIFDGKPKSKIIFDEIINKQLEPHNLTIRDVEGDDGWYMKYTTTKEKNDEWEEWGIKLIERKMHCSKSVALREMSFLSLNYGLRIVEE